MSVDSSTTPALDDLVIEIAAIVHKSDWNGLRDIIRELVFVGGFDRHRADAILGSVGPQA